MGEKRFTPIIENLIDTPDTIELLQKQIAYILKGETAYQHTLAAKNKSADKDIYKMRVHIENARPYDIEGEPPATPFVNILLNKIEAMDGNARSGQQKMKARFSIDCIAFGNDAGDEWDEKAAAARAWKAARIVRRILMSDAYVYLGMRGTVGSRNVVAMESGVPDNGGDATAVVLVRLTLELQYLECAESGPHETLESIYFSVDTSNGEIIMNEEGKEA